MDQWGDLLEAGEYGAALSLLDKRLPVLDDIPPLDELLTMVRCPLASLAHPSPAAALCGHAAAYQSNAAHWNLGSEMLLHVCVIAALCACLCTGRRLCAQWHA
jgi:hypothetical protein